MIRFVKSGVIKSLMELTDVTSGGEYMSAFKAFEAAFTAHDNILGIIPSWHLT